MAVIAPIGISAGAMTVRANTSHKIRKIPPRKADAGSITRWSGPTKSRAMCGMTSPTNPMRPVKETTEAIMMEPIRKMRALSLAVLIPR